MGRTAAAVLRLRVEARRGLGVGVGEARERFEV
jgi:hypothetical protein